METTTIKNWELGQAPSILDSIHKRDVNIAIFNRHVNTMEAELDSLNKKDIEFRAVGDFDAVINAVANTVDLLDYPLIKKDIQYLLGLFRNVTKAQSFRLLLATVKSNMCRKFHTDINDLRMLCTYTGPGTLWLTEDNVNREAEDCLEEDDCLVIDNTRIQQAKTGSVIVLKGAIYPKEGTKAVLHRSPTIEESGERRLLLRFDTNEFLNF